MALASARHILVEDESVCSQIKDQINSDEMSFEEAAMKYSQCPSGDSGGELGTFGKGQMVQEFEDVVFYESMDQIHGPIKTDFGYHLIEITSREE